MLASIRPLVIEVDGAGVVRGAHGGFGGFLGLDVATLVGESVFDHVAPSDAAELATYFIDSAGESFDTISIPLPFRVDLIGGDGRLHPVDVIATGREGGRDGWNWVALLVPVALQAAISQPVDAMINREPRSRVKALLAEELAVDNDVFSTRAFLVEPVALADVEVITSRREDADVGDEIARHVARGWAPWNGVPPAGTIPISTAALPDGLRTLAEGRDWRRITTTPVHVDDDVVAAYVVMGRVPAGYSVDRVLSNIASRQRYIANVTALIMRGWRDRDRLEHAASHDPLTDLANRRAFDAAVAAVSVATGTGTSTGGLLFIDVDDFKSVNDDHGHSVGDAVLIEVGRRIAAACGPGDLPARIGGDEFAVLTGPGTDAERLASAVERSVSAPLHLVDGPDHVSVSVGWVTDTAGDDAFAAAGRAMRRVKRRARSCA